MPNASTLQIDRQSRRRRVLSSDSKKKAAAPNVSPQDSGGLRFRSIVKSARERVKERLETGYRLFLDQAMPEEIQFMERVFVAFDGYYNDPEPRSPLDCQIPLFNAIERQLGGHALVVLRHRDLVPDVENFVAELIEHRDDLYKRRPMNADDSDRKRLRSEAEAFVRDADKQSRELMRALISRWYDLKRDPEACRALGGENDPGALFRAAVEIEAGSSLTRDAVKRTKEALC